MPDFQKAMEEREKRNNPRSLFGVENIPGIGQAKKILDGIEPKELFPAFDMAQAGGVLEDCCVLEGTIPAALDGTWYFSSKETHCGHCLSMTAKKREGTEEDTLYYHEAVCAVAARPGKPVAALPPIPEFVRNEDGQDKQDCEKNAAKRRLKTHKERYSGLKPTVLGDDLYCCHPVCKEIREAGMNFPLVCKDASHPRIAEQVIVLLLAKYYLGAFSAAPKTQACRGFRPVPGPLRAPPIPCAVVVAAAGGHSLSQAPQGVSIIPMIDTYVTDFELILLG
jgi:hypothetical protein